MMRYRHHPSSYAWCFSTSIQNTVGDEIPCKKISIVFAYYNQNNHKIQLHVLPMTSFDLEVAQVFISTTIRVEPKPTRNQQWKSPI